MHVGLHQAGILVFDNYQMCPWPLTLLRRCFITDTVCKEAGFTTFLILKVCVMTTFCLGSAYPFKGSGHYMYLLKIVIICIKKPYLVMSSWELLVVLTVVRSGSLWSNVDFEKEVIFHEFDFDTSDLEFEVPKSRIWKHTTSCDKGFFSHYLATSTTNWAQIFTG